MFLLANPVFASAQCNIKQEVDEVLKFLPQNYNSAEKKAKEIGSDSIPYLVDIIFNDSHATVIQRIHIHPQHIQLIASFKSPIADEALMKLLTHKRAYLRGYATIYLGNRKTKGSIPTIVSLLNDTDVYLTESSSHNPDKYILVRDIAVQALEKITETELLPKKNYELKAKAWLDWFQTNKLLDKNK
jgi:hypothetical protein